MRIRNPTAPELSLQKSSNCICRRLAEGLETPTDGGKKHRRETLHQNRKPNGQNFGQKNPEYGKRSAKLKKKKTKLSGALLPKVPIGPGNQALRDPQNKQVNGDLP